MSRDSIAIRIADAVCKAEIAAARQLGHDALDCLVLGFRTLDETYNRAFEADKLAVYLPAKTIYGPRTERPLERGT